MCLLRKGKQIVVRFFELIRKGTELRGPCLHLVFDVFGLSRSLLAVLPGRGRRARPLELADVLFPGVAFGAVVFD
jgi:hypothetical protein